jgi:hypothetical protein
MSHEAIEEVLPPITVRQLRAVVSVIDETLQEKGYLLAKVGQVDAAFEQAWIESALRRAMIGAAIDEGGWTVEAKQLGGREIIVIERRVQRCFRLRSGRRDSSGRLAVVASNDSLLSTSDVGLQPTLFGPRPAERSEQWVLAYVINPTTGGLLEAVAARPTGFANGRPGRLRFDHEFQIQPSEYEPPSFRGLDEDLEIPGERELGSSTG